MTLRYNDLAKSGNFNTITAGNAVAMNAINIGDTPRLKLRGLSAKVNALAETNTLTLAAKWQVSNDNTNWFDLANGSQNAAGVVLATGTGGADVAIDKIIPAPDAIYGWRWARLAIVVGVTTGAVGDTYAVGYCYRTTRGREG